MVTDMLNFTEIINHFISTTILSKTSMKHIPFKIFDCFMSNSL